MKINDRVLFVGAVDWDNRIFDKLVPLPDGTSYNSYLIKGSEKTALIDTVEPDMVNVLLDNLERAEVESIDYIIAQHAEQDHSGSITAVLDLYPDAMVVTNAKCKQMLIDLLGIEDDKFVEVKDGDTLGLGDKTLEFVFMPWVHWPETMGVYLQEDKIMFTCDFLGAHLAASDVFADYDSAIYEAAKRYYAEIMSPFRTQVNSNLKKLADYDIKMIAPSHGPVHNNPAFIMDAYKEWASDKVKNQVLVAYVSMHGSTARMVSYLVDALRERGIKVHQVELTNVDTGKLAMSLMDSATVIIGSPTVLIGAHPSAAYAAFLANALRPKTRFMTIIGSYGWGSKMVEQLKSMLGNVKAELLEPVVIKGYPQKEALERLDGLADTILEKHQGI